MKYLYFIIMNNFYKVVIQVQKYISHQSKRFPTMFVTIQTQKLKIIVKGDNFLLFFYKMAASGH
jgi:hypothetical protein